MKKMIKLYWDLFDSKYNVDHYARWIYINLQIKVAFQISGKERSFGKGLGQ